MSSVSRDARQWISPSNEAPLAFNMLNLENVNLEDRCRIWLGAPNHRKNPPYLHDAIIPEGQPSL